MEVPLGQQFVAHTQLVFIPAGHPKAENVALRFGRAFQALDAAQKVVCLVGEIKLPVDVVGDAFLAEGRQDREQPQS